MAVHLNEFRPWKPARVHPVPDREPRRPLVETDTAPLLQEVLAKAHWPDAVTGLTVADGCISFEFD